MTACEAIEILEQTGALLNGHFELRSGLHSDRFFQCANALMHPRRAAALCDALAAKTRDGLGVGYDVQTVISPAMGGILVGYEIARFLDVRSIFAEKENGRLTLRRFDLTPGERCLVAEDVVTRGGRVQETIDIVRARGGLVSAVAVLVDRSGGKTAFDVPTFSLIEMAPVTYEPDACPLCRQGIPVVHPGS